MIESSLPLTHVKKRQPEDRAQFIYKCIYKDKQIELFQHELCQIEWKNIIKNLDNLKIACKSFFNIFFETYNQYFPKVN